MSVHNTQTIDPAAMRDLAREGAGLTASREQNSGTNDVPEFIGKYQIVRMIGKGGMGIVYLAKHPELKHRVAIKVMRPDLSWNETRVERFINEARVASRITHPNIVAVHDVDRQDGVPYIVQDYHPNDLATLLKTNVQGRLRISEALDIVEGVCKGLCETWKRGIVHRDIKPENILIGEDNSPKIADMGIAKQYSDSDDPELMRLTRKLSSMGSPMYVAPEQLLNAKDVDVRADIYALGVTLYRMLTGEFPISAATMHEMVQKHRHEPVPDPQMARRDIPRAVADIVIRMLERDPNHRFQTPEELLDALTRARARIGRSLPQRILGIAAALALVGAIAFTAYRQACRSSALDAEKYLSEGRYDDALKIMNNPLLKPWHGERALYGAALCHLRLGHVADATRLCTELELRNNASEYAQHLKALILMAQNRHGEAEELISMAIPNTAHKLPFFLARGLILLKGHDLAGAEEAMTSAMSEAAFFGFQKLRVVELLGKILVSRGRPDSAAQLYAQNLGNSKKGSSDLYTDYAVALMKAGNGEGAQRAIKVALDLDPEDEVARYLSIRSREASSRVRAAGMEQIRELINDIADTAPPADKSQPTWRADPRVLVFLPADTNTPAETRLGDPDRWRELLARRLRQTSFLPVVDRDSLAELLAEHHLSTTNLANRDVTPMTGRLFPASILIRCCLNTTEGTKEFSAELINVLTSEIIDVVEIKNSSDAALVGELDSMCSQIVNAIQKHFPLLGQIMRIEGSQAEINIGTVHGVKEGMKLIARAEPETKSIRALQREDALCALTVTETDRFQSTVELIGDKKPPHGLELGMVVSQPKN